MNIEYTPNRRTFLGTGAAIGFAIYLPVSAATAKAGTTNLQAGAWIRILPDDTVIVYSAASELGQGSMTALPLILAEELDADWDKVRIEMSPVDDAAFGNPKLFNLMLTIASYAVAGYYEALRIGGARARLSLMLGAAQLWGVPVQEVTTKPNLLVHARSGRQMTYGDLARQVKELPQPPEVKPQDLKPSSSFRLIGIDVPRRDIPAKVNGSATYAMNTHLPNLIKATIIRSPFLGATVESFRTKKVRLPGIEVRKLGLDAVAIVGSSMAAVLAARDQVEVLWTKTDATSFSDADSHPKYVAAARDTSQVTRVWDKRGDALAVSSPASTTLEREYGTDYFYHAQIEPLNAVSRVSPDGKSVEIWAGTQAPSYAVKAVARALNIEPGQVTLHRSLSGGAFGRRGAYDQDYVVDAAVLSRDLGKPVKVVWSRDEDVKSGRFKPMTAQWLKASISPEGGISTWRHRVACEDPLVITDPPRYKARNESPAIAMLGTNIPSYGIPNVLVEYARQPIVVRVAPMRGVGAPTAAASGLASRSARFGARGGDGILGQRVRRARKGDCLF